jgi:hypothetical protein
VLQYGILIKRKQNYHSIGTFLKANPKIVEAEAKSMSLT